MALEADEEGLRTLFVETGGADGSWEVARHWVSAPLMQWHGVALGDDEDGEEDARGSRVTPRVTALTLSHNALAGPLSAAAVGPLSALRSLRLCGNALSGSLPAAGLARMRALCVLDLSSNRLTGPLPRALMAIDTLVELRLGGNNFSGPLPSELGAPGRFAALRVLRLHDNAFSGAIPPSWGEPWPHTLPSLRDLDLSGNHLSGAVPIGLLERAPPCFEWRLTLRPGNTELRGAADAGLTPRTRATFRGDRGDGSRTFVLSLAALWEKATAALPCFEDALAAGLLHEVLPTPRLAADGLLFLDRVGHVPREKVTYVGHDWPRLGLPPVGVMAAAGPAPLPTQKLARLRAALGGGGHGIEYAWLDCCCVPHYARAADATAEASARGAHGTQATIALGCLLAVPRHMHSGCGSFTLLAADALDALDDGWCRAEVMLAMCPRRSVLQDHSGAGGMVHWSLMPVWIAEEGGAAVPCGADGLPVQDPLQGDVDDNEARVALVVALARAAAEQMEEAAGAEDALVPAPDLLVAQAVRAAMCGGLAAASAAAAAAALGAAHTARVAALAAARAVRAASTVYVAVEAAAAAAEAATAAAACAHRAADAALAAAAACGAVDEGLFELEVLQARCPPGVDAARKEASLKLNDYQRAFGMSKEQYDDVPNFKKRQLKRAANLF